VLIETDTGGEWKVRADPHEHPSPIPVIDSWMSFASRPASLKPRVSPSETLARSPCDRMIPPYPARGRRALPDHFQLSVFRWLAVKSPTLISLGYSASIACDYAKKTRNTGKRSHCSAGLRSCRTMLYVLSRRRYHTFFAICAASRGMMPGARPRGITRRPRAAACEAGEAASEAGAAGLDWRLAVGDRCR
jgi:hypothetical protein